MNLLIMIPVRPKGISADWAMASRRARVAIKSALAAVRRTGGRSRVLVIASELPIDMPRDPMLEVAMVEPAMPLTLEQKLDNLRGKYAVGAEHFLNGEYEHFMRIADDDMVSCKFLDSAPKVDMPTITVFGRGYLWPEGKGYVFNLPNFDQFAGPCGYFSIPLAQKESLPNSVRCFLNSGGHNEFRDGARHGFRVRFEKRPYTIYRIDSGDNISGEGMRNMFSRRHIPRLLMAWRPLSGRIKIEFGLERYLTA